MANLAEDLIELIQEHPTRRKEADIAFVTPWLKKRSKMLATQNDAVLMDLVKHCEHQQNERDDVIIRQGERGDRSDDTEPRFYVLLSGTVSVYIDPRMTGEEDTGGGGIKPASAKKKVAIKEETKTEGDINDKESENSEEKEATMTENNQEKKAQEHQKQHPKRIKELDRTKFGKMIVQYGPGDSFGEVALIKRDAYRNATIIADEQCDLMLIGEDLYDRSLKSYQEQEFASVGRFIDNHPYFCDMPVKLKKLLEMSLRKESFIFDSVMIRQGDPVFGMMFITNGQANITVEPHKHPKQYPQLWPFEAGIDIYSIEFEFLREPRRQAILRKYEDPSVWETKSEDVVIRRTEGYAAIERRMKERHIDLCSVATGEVIGDTEILMNLSTYLHTIKCTANTDVFILDTKNFERCVGKKNTTTLDLIRKYVKSKLKTRMEMKNGPLIPLLPYLYYKLTEQTLPVEKPLPPLKTSKHLPDKDYQTKHLLHLFKEGKANLVEPIVPGAQYYKELMLQKAKARKINRQAEEPTSTASLRALKRGGRKQPRSLMAIRESLREMMDAEVINIDTKKTKNKLKGTKKKSRSKASLVSEEPMHENIIMDSSSTIGGSSAKSVRSKSDKSASQRPDNQTKVVNNRADDNNNSINNQPKPDENPLTEVIVPKKDDNDIQRDNNNATDSKRKFKPVLITEMNSSKNVLDLPAIHEEKTQEELQLRSPIISTSPQRNETIAKPKLKLPLNTNEKDNSEEFEVQSDRLEHVETVIGLEKQTEDEQRLILPQLRPKKEKKKMTRKQMSAENVNQESVPWDTTMKFVNERIQSRLAATSLDDLPVSFDYESSEPTLRLLESRIQAFHLKYGEKTRKTMKLPKLARFDAPREEPELPLPGAKVWVKKRACQFATNKVRVKDHAHTRHHVVHEIPEFDQVKRTKQMLSILTEDVVPKNEMFA